MEFFFIKCNALLVNISFYATFSFCVDAHHISFYIFIKDSYKMHILVSINSNCIFK